MTTKPISASAQQTIQKDTQIIADYVKNNPTVPQMGNAASNKAYQAAYELEDTFRTNADPYGDAASQVLDLTTMLTNDEASGVSLPQSGRHFYKQMLEGVFMSEKQTRRKFSGDIRRDVVKMVIEGGKTCSEIAVTHQVPVTSVYAWVHQARVLSGVGANPGSPSLAQLQAENARLRKELKLAKGHALLLRKTAAFFASEKS